MSTSPSSSPPHIIVSIEPLGGWGDISAGVKIANTLCKITALQEYGIIFTSSVTPSNCSKKLEYCIPPNKVEEFTSPIFRDIQYQGKVKFSTLEEISDETVKNCPLIVLGPTANVLQEKIYKCFDQKSQPPILALTEYSHLNQGFFHNTYTIRTGLCEFESGVFIDAELAEIADQELKLSFLDRELSISNRLNFLNELEDRRFFTAITQNTMEKYIKGNNLFFCYSHHIVDSTNFVKLVSIKEKGKEKNLDFVIIKPCEKQEFYSWMDNFSKLKKYFKECNVHKVIFYIDEGKEYKLHECETGFSQGTKILRFFFKEKLKKNDSLTLLKAANPFCLVTGDQTLSEAISLGNHFLYNKLLHKVKLFNGLLNLASPSLRNWMNSYRSLFQENEVGVFDNTLTTTYEQVANQYNTEIKKEFDSLNQFIRRSRKLQDNIQTIVMNILNHENQCLDEKYLDKKKNEYIISGIPIGEPINVIEKVLGLPLATSFTIEAFNKRDKKEKEKLIIFSKQLMSLDSNILNYVIKSHIVETIKTDQEKDAFRELMTLELDAELKKEMITHSAKLCSNDTLTPEQYKILLMLPNLDLKLKKVILKSLFLTVFHSECFNFDLLKNTLNSDLPDEVKKTLIINVEWILYLHALSSYKFELILDFIHSDVETELKLTLLKHLTTRAHRGETRAITFDKLKYLLSLELDLELKKKIINNSHIRLDLFKSDTGVSFLQLSTLEIKKIVEQEHLHWKLLFLALHKPAKA